MTRMKSAILSTLLLLTFGAVGVSAQLLSNGTYEVTAQSSGLALAANGTSNGSAVSQQTYTGASTQQWVLNNLGSNVVSLEVSGTSEALEAPGATQGIGAMLDVSAYVGGTHQQWTIVSVGSGYYEVVNVNSGQEVNVAYGSTSPGGLICQYLAGNYANGVWSFTVAGGGGSAPAAPTNLAAIAANAQVALSWTASTGATSYNVYRGTSAGGESATAIATGVSSTSYADAGLTSGTTYYYKVAAVNTTGTSGYSNEASATPAAGGSYLVSNGTYEVVAQSSALALAANDTSNGSAVSQQTYAGTSVQQWVLNNLGSNVVSLEVSGTSEALEVPGSSQTPGAMLDVSAYTGATNQQWTLVSVGSGYYEVINVCSGQEVNVAYGSTSPGGQICQYFSGNYANGVWSFTAASGGGSAPAAPTNLAATAGNAQVALSWTASTGATSYNVYRGTSAGGENATAIATGISSTSYTDSSLTNGTAYYYKVTAVNSYGTSSNSNEANATPISGGSAPAAPTNLTANASNAQVALSWTVNTGATSYNVYRGTSAGGESATALATGISSTSYTDTGLTNGTTYYYKAVAVNTTGMSGYSNEASATPTGSSSGNGSLVLAVGLEKVVSTYSGPLAQIKRPSDNTVLDISFAPGSNALNMASVSAFLGTSQGWITKLYDQSGNGNTVLAPTTSGTDNMPTISMVAPTAITNSGTTYLTARNVVTLYGPNGEGNNRYFIIPPSVSVDKSQTSAFLAYRPDYSGGACTSMFEVGDPTVDAVDLMSNNTGFQGLTHNSTLTFQNGYIMPRSQPTVVGLVTTPGSTPTLYIDGVSHDTGGNVPTSATCSGGYLMAGTGSGLFYSQSLFAQFNFLAFEVYNGTVSPSSASSISNTMLPRTIPSINIVVDGDSVTQGLDAVYGWEMIRYAEPLLNQPADISNIALAGSPAAAALFHISYPTPATSAVGQLYSSSYSKSIYYVAMGTNDVIAMGSTGAAAWATVQQTLQNAKAMGFKTVAATLMHSINETPSVTNEVNNFNALVRGAVGQGYLDAVTDYAADPRLGVASNFYPTYSSDSVHPNDAGYQIMGAIAAPVFNSLIGQ